VVAQLDDHSIGVGRLGLVGRRGAATQTIARTCWQDGLAVGADRLFTGLASVVKGQADGIGAAGEALLEVRLGGTVIGSGAGAPAAYRSQVVAKLAAATGLDLRPAPDLYAATQYPDDLARLSSAVTQASHVLAKFAQDLRWLSSGPECGLGELRLPATQAGSSFFPGKVNPVIPETVIQADILIAGQDAAAQRCLALGEGHLNPWEETMGFLVLDNLRMLARAADLFERLCLAGVEFEPEICERYAHSAVPQVVAITEDEGYGAVSAAIEEEGMAAFLARHNAPKETS
jgi:aspartate ammonia-lyase